MRNASTEALHVPSRAPAPGRPPKTRSARVQHGGRLIEFGRRPPAEAKRIEDDARRRLARGERLEGVRAIRQARGSTIHAYDAELWMETDDVEEMTGPQKLMLGVLEDAKQKLGSRHADEVREATRWILSDDRSHLCAFVTICEAFGVEPAEIRCALLADRYASDGRRAAAGARA